MNLSLATASIGGLSSAAVIAIGAVVLVVAIVIAAWLGRRSGRRALAHRLVALGARLGVEEAQHDANIETALTYLEQATSAATAAVTEASADAIRLRRSLDTLTHGIVICDESGAVVYRNTRANALMQSRHGDALAAQAVTDLLADAWRDGQAERTLDLYGPPRTTLNVRAVLIDDGRRPLGVIAMIEDFTERRRLEEIRRDFVANVSHELKTPMGAMGLLAETLVAEKDPAVINRLADRIHAEAFRVSRIIDDLLDLSRIESEVTPPREPVLVNLVMAEAVERVRSSAEHRKIAIVLDEPQPAITVLGDRRQLVSALHALLENAITYSSEGSTVVIAGVAVTPAKLEPASHEDAIDHVELPTPVDVPLSISLSESDDSPTEGDPTPEAPSEIPVATAPPSDAVSWEAEESDLLVGNHVRLSVSDRGIGIPARDLDRIFERFYRVDFGRSRETGGTGLGLAIVRHVATNHHGRVEVESREGEGSTFTLILPLQGGITQ